MVILSLGCQYKPNNGGNATRVSVMSEAFVKLGHKVIVCTITQPSKDGNNDKNYFRESGVEVLRFPSIKAVLKRLNKLIVEYKVDIVLAHDYTTWLYSCMMVKHAYVTSECHAITVSVRHKQIIKDLGYKIMRKRTKALFVLSQNAKNVFVEKYGFNDSIIHFTPNGIENKQCDEELHFGDKKEFVYAYGGTLYDWQGIRVLLKHCMDILNIAPDVVIKIVGGGPIYAEVKQFISDNNLEKRVHATGFLEKQAFNEQLKSADVLLIPRPSVVETETAIPLKIFDAVRSNKPIIMSDVSGLTEVLSKTEALIFPSKNTNQFVECCKEIYRNEGLASSLTEAARIKIGIWPSNLNMAQKQIEILRGILEK